MEFQSVLKVYLMTKNGQNMAKIEKIRKMQIIDNKEDKFFYFPIISMPCTGSGYKIEEAVAAGLQPFFFSNFHPEFCRPGPIVPATRIALTRTGHLPNIPCQIQKIEFPGNTVLGIRFTVFISRLSIPATHNLASDIDRYLIRIGVDYQRQRMLHAGLELECIFQQVGYVVHDYLDKRAA